eukprot:1143406-Rhodomonas_salina.3
MQEDLHSWWEHGVASLAVQEIGIFINPEPQQEATAGTSFGGAARTGAGAGADQSGRWVRAHAPHPTALLGSAPDNELPLQQLLHSLAESNASVMDCPLSYP